MRCRLQRRVIALVAGWVEICTRNLGTSYHTDIRARPDEKGEKTIYVCPENIWLWVNDRETLVQEKSEY